MIEFIKDYKHDEKLRRSFDALAMQTFGISFEAWYQSGCWNASYMPYSYEVDGKIVANASANKMKLIIEGRPVDAIQIGTVMTDPEFRRRGLAYDLIQRIIADFEDDAEFFYLAADDEAMALYRKCGFVDVPEVKYAWQNPLGSPESLKRTLVPASMTLEALCTVKSSALLKGAKLEIVEDEHILAFYWHHGFNEKLYRLDDMTVLIADIVDAGKGLVLYDVFVQNGGDARFDLSNILARTGATTVKFAFDVAGLITGLEKECLDPSGWMVRSAGNSGFPALFSYPKLAQA
ncbi:MAG TPA: hypothetical protein DCS67_02005 [Clostridiales bacterium UBA8960]|nr:hypothetical protein [Clostridiales bacterium UBA8960]